NNRAVQQASGALLCFLNNDIEIEETGWLVAMARQAVRPDVGAVGAQLLYPDGRIQHAGVVIGIGGAAAHAHRLLKPDEEGYFHRHALPQFVSAVTAACMVVDRTKFDAVGGFDAERFAVSFNDVDLCLRLGARGWRSLYEPRARLVHHESVSRGLDRDKTGAARQAREAAFLNDLWNTRLATQGATPDPFHHPHLSRLSEHFVPAL
ncbi:MAG: glycosyl transferase, partial [Alphaproteobacteria bacterium HGW-Alphaproteobacteria-9]